MANHLETGVMDRTFTSTVATVPAVKILAQSLLRAAFPVTRDDARPNRGFTTPWGIHLIVSLVLLCQLAYSTLGYPSVRTGCMIVGW